jgi:hypothetical protein
MVDKKRRLDLVANPIYSDSKEMFKAFLRHTCTLLPEDKQLTKTEIDILTAFWLFNDEDTKAIRFTAPIKKIVRDTFGFKHYANLENYLNSLKAKGFIVKNKHGINIINPSFDLGPTLEILTVKYEYRLQENS